MSDWGKILLGGLAVGGLLALARRPAAAPPANPARDETRTVGATAIRVVGAGPVAWYFHGFGATLAGLGPVLHTLAAAGWTIAAPQLGPKSEGHAGLYDDLAHTVGAPAALLAHSGGYKALAGALGRADTVALLDALYGEVDAFAAFIERAGTRFVDVAGPSTRATAEALKAAIHPHRVYAVTNTDVDRLADADSRIHPVLFATTTVAHDAVPAAFGPAILRGWLGAGA